MGKITCEKIVLVFLLHSLIYVHGASTAIGRKTLADLEIRRELKRLNKPAIKTIKSEDGDIIDCVDIYKQPAFDHPLLRNHTIQMRPSFYDRESMSSSSKLPEQLWHKSRSCPEVTIPIRRTGKRHLIGASRSLAAVSSQMESAKLSFNKSLQGGEGVINVWNPRVEVPIESSKASIFVGRRDSLDLVSSGWMVSPSMFGDDATRLYAFWGTDDKIGCYDLKCPGFVQTNQEISLGAALPVSSYGAEQIITAVKIFKMRPSFYDRESMSSSSKLPDQLWHKSGSCPEGTIPIRRTGKRHLIGASRSLAAASSQMEVANEVKLESFDYLVQCVSAKLSFNKSLQGGEGVINVWNPRVEVPIESSKASIFVGRRDSLDLVSSGWMVSPSMFGDDATRLYAFWGTDNKIGCYDLKCPGFVQTNQEISLGAALPVSSYGAEQIITAVKIFRENGNGNWWLVVHNTTVGYWQSSLFKSMAKSADYI